MGTLPSCKNIESFNEDTRGNLLHQSASFDINSRSFNFLLSLPDSKCVFID